MSESFVDLSYRGLALGKRIKLTEVRPSSGYLVMPAPMPVGTVIGIASDEDGVVIEAQVAEIHEQVGGSDRAPGMLVRPKLDAEAQTWWSARVALPEIAPKPEEPAKVTVVSRRTDTAVPELVDDGHNTSVMNAIDPDTQIADVPVVSPRTTNPGMAVVTESPNQIIDDGKRTMMMDAVDLAALGLDPSISGQMPVITEVEDESSGVVDKPDGGKKKKKKKR
ncbi:MAG: hypothetical protein HOV81_44785 [Kofleriaceae bacterium]|nr:hypothetical protein [Kofleriaceae bacterium]